MINQKPLCIDPKRMQIDVHHRQVTIMWKHEDEMPDKLGCFHEDKALIFLRENLEYSGLRECIEHELAHAWLAYTRIGAIKFDGETHAEFVSKYSDVIVETTNYITTHLENAGESENKWRFKL